MGHAGRRSRLVQLLRHPVITGEIIATDLQDARRRRRIIALDHHLQGVLPGSQFSQRFGEPHRPFIFLPEFVPGEPRRVVHLCHRRIRNHLHHHMVFLLQVTRDVHVGKGELLLTGLLVIIQRRFDLVNEYLHQQFLVRTGIDIDFLQGLGQVCHGIEVIPRMEGGG